MLSETPLSRSVLRVAPLLSRRSPQNQHWEENACKHGYENGGVHAGQFTLPKECNQCKCITLAKVAAWQAPDKQGGPHAELPATAWPQSGSGSTFERGRP